VSLVFKQGTHGGHLHGHHWEAGKTLIGIPITFELRPRNKRNVFLELERGVEAKLINGPPGILAGMYSELAATIEGPFADKLFFRLAADRRTFTIEGYSMIWM
jgi:hypothetical protein